MGKVLVIFIWGLFLSSCQSKSSNSSLLIPFPHHIGEKTTVFINRVKNFSKYKNGILVKGEKNDELESQGKASFRSLLEQVSYFTLVSNKRGADYSVNLHILDLRIKEIPVGTLFGFLKKRSKEIIVCKLRLHINDLKTKKSKYLDSEISFQPNSKELDSFTLKDNYDINLNNLLLTQAINGLIHKWLADSDKIN